MLKKLLYCLSAVLLTTGCYEDKGSYDYRFDKMNDIDLNSITFTPDAYDGIGGTIIEIQQPDEDKVQRIGVNFNQTIESGFDNLEFSWKRSYTAIDENGSRVSVVDTLHTPGYVDLDFPANKDMQYALTLIIKDKSTSLSYYKAFTVKTRPIFKNSLFILHGEQGNRKLGNVEIIGNRAEVRTDAYKTVFPNATDNPFAKGIALGFSAYIQIVGDRYNRTLGVFNHDGTGKVFDPYGLKEKFAAVTDYLLPSTATPVIYKQLIALGNPATMQDSKCLIDRLGNFYVAGSYMCFVPGNNNIPPYNTQHQKDYNIATGTIMANYMVFWDSKHERFLYQQKCPGGLINGRSDATARQTAQNVYMNPVLNANVDFSSLGHMTPVGKRAIYAYIASTGNDYYNAHPLFIFKDDNTEKFYIYDLTHLEDEKDDKAKGSITGDDGKGDDKGEEEPPAFSITARELPMFRPGENTASIMYSHCFSTNYLFYANGGSVYRYNTSNGDTYTVYTAPDGYTVSMMKFRTTYASDHTGYLGRYLSIALEKDGHGAVTEVALNNAGDVDETFKSVLYEGDANGKFGKIIDLQFVHNFLDE